MRKKPRTRRIPIEPEVYKQLCEIAKEKGLTPDEYAEQITVECLQALKEIYSD